MSARALTTAVNLTEHLNVMNRGHVVSLGEPPPNKCGNFFGQCFWNVYGQEVTVVMISFRREIRRLIGVDLVSHANDPCGAPFRKSAVRRVTGTVPKSIKSDKIVTGPEVS